jgi:hypothetical protein
LVWDRYATRPNPAKFADRRAEPDPLHLAFYSPEQVEVLAQGMAAGAHRDRARVAVASDEVVARAADDPQDAEIVRIAAFAGLRRGGLVATALPWGPELETGPWRRL